KESIEICEIKSFSGERETKSIENIGGTRHQSAARFVNENQEAMAIVVSQDGHISIFVWDNVHGVCAYKNLEYTLL
ncbi:MAG TPA: diadenylate cyclase, partial [Acidobacteriota bacterium]|nr:diadenylate cyclase [Acidobacteriota bacterium]